MLSKRLIKLSEEAKTGEARERQMATHLLLTGLIVLRGICSQSATESMW
jgi:hypothetical protein